MLKKVVALCVALCLSLSAGSALAGKPYVARIIVEDEISEYSYYYDHVGVLAALEELMEDRDNRALLLYLNTPGGSMYEVDELYVKLMAYRETTGRPVYAFAAQAALSGGMYVAMAADRFMAARMSDLGSIGVIYTLTSEAGLYEKLGIESYIVASGENKAFGWPELTEEQRAFLQESVDEAFDVFVQIICEARGLTREEVLAFADGRTFTAKKALEYGLIDAVMTYDEAVDALYAAAGLDDAPLVDYPAYDEEAWDEWDDMDWIQNEEDNLLDWIEERLTRGVRQDGLMALARPALREAVAR